MNNTYELEPIANTIWQKTSLLFYDVSIKIWWSNVMFYA